MALLTRRRAASMAARRRCTAHTPSIKRTAEQSSTGNTASKRPGKSIHQTRRRAASMAARRRCTAHTPSIKSSAHTPSTGKTASTNSGKRNHQGIRAKLRFCAGVFMYASEHTSALRSTHPQGPLHKTPHYAQRNLKDRCTKPHTTLAGS